MTNLPYSLWVFCFVLFQIVRNFLQQRALEINNNCFSSASRRQIKKGNLSATSPAKVLDTIWGLSVPAQDFPDTLSGTPLELHMDTEFSYVGYLFYSKQNEF